MKKRLVVSLFSLVAVAIIATLAFSALTAEEIIKRRDDNEYYDTARAEAEMVIVNRNRKISKTMTTYGQGDNGLIIFSNPRDRGTKFLKRGDDLWMFFPDAEDLVKISGHMLNQGMMGSDFSYQDMMESDKLTDLYQFKLIGERDVPVMCWKGSPGKERKSPIIGVNHGLIKKGLLV